MKLERLQIAGIPSLLWGEKSNKVWIAVHGNLSHKEDEVIKMLAEEVVEKGYQVLSFDLPEHGERKNEATLCKVQNCVADLNKVMEYAKENYEEVNLWACSMGAYFSLLTYQDELLNQCLFLSPVVNMKVIIDNMMKWSNTTEEVLKEKQEVKTDFGPTLYWDYYQYVKAHPITKWNHKTCILYGDKDNMQEQSLMQEFASKFHCELSVVEHGEHFFHTKEQLACYQKWLEESIS